MTVGLITLHDMVTVEARYDPDERWNGWLCPQFTREQAAVLVDELNAADGFGTWSWDGDTVVEETDPELTDPLTIRHEPDSDGLYAIGAYGWTWFEVDET